MLQLQSPNKNHINGTQISGNLICTFSNPFIGVVKSDISLFKSLSAQPDVTRDMMLEQYWDMDHFHEEWQTNFWKNTHFRIEKIVYLIKRLMRKLTGIFDWAIKA